MVHGRFVLSSVMMAKRLTILDQGIANLADAIVAEDVAEGQLVRSADLASVQRARVCDYRGAGERRSGFDSSSRSCETSCVRCCPKATENPKDVRATRASFGWSVSSTSSTVQAAIGSPIAIARSGKKEGMAPGQDLNLRQGG